jgi:hypothetical protein
MAIDTTFKPLTATFALASGTALQPVPKDASSGVNSFRIKNTGAARAYINWGLAAPGVPVAPAVGVPVPNSVGLEAAGTIYLDLPQSVFFNCSAAATFEITPGSGGTGG